MVLFVCVLLGTASSAFAQVTVYTDEAAYLADLAGLGLITFQEGFEAEPPWDPVRTTNPLSPVTAPSITSQGIAWTSNHPDVAGSEITTSDGAAHEGYWGLYSYPHGDPTVKGAGLDCTETPAPAGCFKHDGVVGTRQAGASALYGVAGWARGTPGGKLILILDGDEANPVNFGDSGILSNTFRFFGVIDAAGFTKFEFRETEGVVGDEKFVFVDTFTFGVVQIDGDIDSDGDVDVSDAVSTLRIVAGMIPDVANVKADLNGDGRIGMEEAAFILQKISRVR